MLLLVGGIYEVRICWIKIGSFSVLGYRIFRWICSVDAVSCLFCVVLMLCYVVKVIVLGVGPLFGIHYLFSKLRFFNKAENLESFTCISVAHL